MPLRAYLTLLRPVRTLLLGLINSGCCGVLFLRYCGNCSLAEALYFTCVIVGPLIFGDLLAGPAHEFMNRSVFPLIPGARRQLRRQHLHGLLALAALLLAAASAVPSEFPLAAQLGLIAAGLTLPLLNSRRVGWSYFVLLLLISPLLTTGPRETFVAACQAAPWAFLSLGLLCAGFCIRHIFSASFAGNYWKMSYVVSIQTLAPFYDTTMMQRRREDNERRAIAKRTRPEREWRIAAVGTSVREWSRAIRHARFGGTSWLWSEPGIVAFCAFPVIVYGAIPLVFAYFGRGNAISLQEYCGMLIAGAHGTELASSPGHFAFTSLPYTSIMVTMFASSVAAVPTTRFPLSRRRLADSLFVEMLRLGALGCLGFALAYVVVIVGAVLVTRTPIDYSLFARALSHIRILPTVVLLGIAFVFSTVRYRWMASFGGYLLWAAVGGALGGLAMAITESILGAYIWLPGLILSAWLARTAIRRYYATHDLNRLMPWVARFAGRCA